MSENQPDPREPDKRTPGGRSGSGSSGGRDGGRSGGAQAAVAGTAAVAPLAATAGVTTAAMTVVTTAVGAAIPVGTGAVTTVAMTAVTTVVGAVIPVGTGAVTTVAMTAVMTVVASRGSPVGTGAGTTVVTTVAAAVALVGTRAVMTAVTTVAAAVTPYRGRDDRREPVERGSRDRGPTAAGTSPGTGGREGDRERGPYRGRDEAPRGGRRDDRRDDRRGAGRGGGARGGHAPRGGQRPDRDAGTFDNSERRGGSRLAPKAPRLPDPRIAEGVTGKELDRSVHQQLRTLSKENAEGVAQHLVMVAALLEADDMVGAEAHAETAVRRAGRVPAAREALGLVAYRKGEWARALSEFRTARRLSGSSHMLPLMVDCERGLGRPERALELATSPEARTLTLEERIELAIVISGIRRDLGSAPGGRAGPADPAAEVHRPQAVVGPAHLRLRRRPAGER